MVYKMFSKVILTILILSMITFTASASATISVNVHRIQALDLIEGSSGNEADWYYYVGLSNDNENIEWQSSPLYSNQNDIQLTDTYTFTSTSLNPYIIITLCERDYSVSPGITGSVTELPDDLADISSKSSGGTDDVALHIETSTTSIYHGTFKSQYDLSSNQFISGDTTQKDGAYYKVSGDFDNNLGDENDANLWFSISDNYELPSADAGNDIYSKVGDLVNFNGMASVSFGSSIVRYQWDFNDDGVYDSEGLSSSYTYSKAGTYTAKFKITDSYGEVSTDTVQVTIQTIPPIAGFVYSPSNPYTSDTVVFTDTSTDQDGTISSWSWDFGDRKTSKEKNPSHKYQDDGTYTVKLRVTDNDGASNTKSSAIKVINIVPKTEFTYSPSKPTTDDDVKFTDISTDQDGTISSWLWDFGDGYTSKNMNPTHKYQSAGTYKVKLTIKDNDGASDDFSKSIVVSESSLSNTIKNKISNPVATEKSLSSSTNDDESTPGFTIILGIINIFLIFLVRKNQM